LDGIVVGENTNKWEINSGFIDLASKSNLKIFKSKPPTVFLDGIVVGENTNNWEICPPFAFKKGGAKLQVSKQ